MPARMLMVIFALLLFLVPAGNSSAAQIQAQYAGDDSCKECHEEIYQGFRQSVHGVSTDPRTPAARNKGFTCESCHGPGSIHAEEGEGGNIRALNARAQIPAEEKNAVCLRCHTKGKTALWQNSTHAERALSCSDCHKVHGQNPKLLARSSQTELCTACHRQVRPLLFRRSHHPLREGKMQCSDCHNAHGTIADKLVDAQYINLKCYECHAKIRGPHIWEHPSVVENCLTCHTPHGSVHAALLTARPPYLCQRCHANADHPRVLQARNSAQAGASIYGTLNNIGFYRACLNCHVAIHGSNHPSGKSFLR